MIIIMLLNNSLPNKVFPVNVSYKINSTGFNLNKTNKQNKKKLDEMIYSIT